MHDGCIITDIPEDYGKDNPLPDASEKAIRKMVKKHPAVFAGERWDKYREAKQEEAGDEISQTNRYIDVEN